MRRIEEALRELSREYRSVEAPERLRRKVAAAFRPGRRDWGLAWMAAPAAAVLGLLAWMPPEVETLELRTWAPPAPEVRMAPKTGARRAVKTKQVEIVSDFFPLRAGPVLGPGELGQVVRTAVPRREARRMGFLLDEVGDGPDLPADVLVGGDGSARAVRFVVTAGYR
jgi:hypothetical protein